jgi:hypothetical protein
MFLSVKNETYFSTYETTNKQHERKRGAMSSYRGADNAQSRKVTEKRGQVKADDIAKGLVEPHERGRSKGQVREVMGEPRGQRGRNE